MPPRASLAPCLRAVNRLWLRKPCLCSALCLSVVCMALLGRDLGFAVAAQRPSPPPSAAVVLEAGVAAAAPAPDVGYLGAALCAGCLGGFGATLLRLRRQRVGQPGRKGCQLAAWIDFGVQSPPVSLPEGVVEGQAPQTFEVSPEDIERFRRDGVLHVRGALRSWAPFLQQVTDHQLQNPSIWSVIGKGGDVYEYLQRNLWMTNDGFRDAFYYSPLGHVLAQLCGSAELRLSTDMLQVNPQSPLGWHQDNQNGPIDNAYAVRWWLAMDSSGPGGAGVPEFLVGSHRNASVGPDATSVDGSSGDLPSFSNSTCFEVEPGDLIVWHVRTVHRLLPTDSQRRAWGGTSVVQGAKYAPQGAASAISDLGGHDLEAGMPLSGPYFPRIFPQRLQEETEPRARQQLERMSPKRIASNLQPLFQRMLGPMFSVDLEKASYLENAWAMRPSSC
eukprot:TRINITY_DN44029_c0_g1_i2.p1 TRINITY_DN44029_c0_g1~~TRINITY_DN44029_c0_g1_i2.p1  ORF type:complete len:445 (-),score=68.68 TRINITY_DN44029_c0_g1_i2:270-1604(-)